MGDELRKSIHRTSDELTREALLPITDLSLYDEYYHYRGKDRES